MINPEGTDPKLMYLDPHFVQDAVSSHRAKLWIDSLYINEENTGEHWLDPDFIKSNFHCAEVRTMSLARICPSLAIGFYLRDMEDFHRFKAQIEEMRRSSGDDCIFSVFKMREDSGQYQMEKKIFSKPRTVDEPAKKKELATSPRR